MLKISFEKILVKTKKEENEKRRKRKELTKYLDLYVLKQSIIRNKIAHGQWLYPLDKNNSKISKRLKKLKFSIIPSNQTLVGYQYQYSNFKVGIDTDLLNQLNTMNVVSIMIEFEVHTCLGKIIRDLVQSPNIGFNQNYNNHLLKLNEYLKQSSNWNMNNKINIVKNKQKRWVK